MSEELPPILSFVLPLSLPSFSDIGLPDLPDFDDSMLDSILKPTPEFSVFSAVNVPAPSAASLNSLFAQDSAMTPRIAQVSNSSTISLSIYE